jgi:hypothetical protein
MTQPIKAQLLEEWRGVPAGTPLEIVDRAGRANDDVIVQRADGKPLPGRNGLARWAQIPARLVGPSQGRSPRP